MDRWLRMAVVAMVAMVACSSSTEGKRDPPEARSSELRSHARRITILHVTDTHSHLEAIGPKDRRLDGTLGGLVKAATVVQRERAADSGVLFVHTGDVFQEDVYFATTAGVAELQLLAGLGLDAIALGNHEFDLTPQALLGALSSSFAPFDASPGGTLAPSPVVAANLDFANQSLDGLQAFVRPGLVKQVGGVRVGFFGLVTDDPAEQFPGAREGDPPAVDTRFVEIAAAQVAALRSPPASADVVILLSHLGFPQDEEIARSVPGIDAILGGHDHLLRSEVIMRPGGKRVPIAHPGEFYRWVGKLTLVVRDGRVTFEREEFIPVDAEVERFAPFAEVVQGPGGLQEQANTILGEEMFHTAIAFASRDVPQQAQPGAPQRDSPVANLITDALRAAGATDVALTANGFLTEGLTHGLLVRDDAFRIVGDGFDPDVPFAFEPGARLGFPLFRIALPGVVLEQALAGALALGGDYFPQVSGMSVCFDSTDPAFLRVRIGDAPLAGDRTYTLTVNLGLLQGLMQLVPTEAIGFLPSPDRTEYEAVRDWLEQLRVVAYGSEGRVLDMSRR